MKSTEQQALMITWGLISFIASKFIDACFNCCLTLLCFLLQMIFVVFFVWTSNLILRGAYAILAPSTVWSKNLRVTIFVKKGKY